MEFRCLQSSCLNDAQWLACLSEPSGQWGGQAKGVGDLEWAGFIVKMPRLLNRCQYQRALQVQTISMLWTVQQCAGDLEGRGA